MENKEQKGTRPSSNPESHALSKAERLLRKKQYESAINLFTRLAATGSWQANLRLGWIYSNGKGVKIDHEKAEYFYHEAATSGDPRAEWYLARFYGRRKNYEKAIEWYRKSAEKNFPAAVYWLGALTFFGHGVKKNEKLGMEMIRKAYELGHVRAQFIYARFLISGKEGIIPIFRGIAVYLSACFRTLSIGMKDEGDSRLLN